MMIRNVVLIVCSFFSFCGLSAQNGQESIAYTRDSVRHVNRSCEYPGHMEGLMADVYKKLNLPKTVKKEELHGKVFLRLTIDTEGQPIEPTIVKGVRPDVDDAVVQMSKKLQRFEPATMDGKKVKTSILIPVSF
jgi:TonB family protein